MANDSWTTERVELLTQMRKRAPRDIRDALNQLPGPMLTRSAVIGKQDRLFGVRRPVKTDEEKAATLKAGRERDAAVKRAKRKSNGIGSQVQAINRRQDRIAKHAQPGSDPEPFQCQDVDVIPLRLSLSDLERADRKCRWPYDALPDEPGEGSFRFCGHVCLDGSYCFSHKLLSMGRGTSSERQATTLPNSAAA